MADFKGQHQINNNDIKATLVVGGRQINLTTLDLGSFSRVISSTMTRDGSGKPNGYKFGESGGGEFTLKLEKWEADKCFPPEGYTDEVLKRTRFTLSLKMPIQVKDDETGEVRVDYGATRQVVYSDCAVTGNFDDSMGQGEQYLVSLPCSFLARTETAIVDA